MLTSGLSRCTHSLESVSSTESVNGPVLCIHIHLPAVMAEPFVADAAFVDAKAFLQTASAGSSGMNLYVDVCMIVGWWGCAVWM